MLFCRQRNGFFIFRNCKLRRSRLVIDFHHFKAAEVCVLCKYVLWASFDGLHPSLIYCALSGLCVSLIFVSMGCTHH